MELALPRVEREPGGVAPWLPWHETQVGADVLKKK
jgi:hypothetical protein